MIPEIPGGIFTVVPLAVSLYTFISFPPTGAEVVGTVVVGVVAGVVAGWVVQPLNTSIPASSKKIAAEIKGFRLLSESVIIADTVSLPAI
jgi:hypothetical protein